MLEALAALGVAANIVQLVGFGTHLAHNVKSVLDSSLDSLPANEELLEHVANYKALYCDVDRVLSENQYLSQSELAAKEAAFHLLQEIDQLTTDLDELKVSASTTRLKRGISTIRQSVRTHRKSADLEARHQNLIELTNILGAKVLLVLHHRTDSRLHYLQETLAAQGIRHSNHVTNLHTKVLELIHEQEKRELEAREKAIRKSLLFDSMDYRRNIIAERHRKTFEWCFQKDVSSLQEWLETRNGIYWISGKAGSGKSTFMKFLSSHRKTVESLRKWAGPCELVIAEHFFYYAGTHMQKSHQGLLQSLLHQLLCAGTSRNLASVICRERWTGGYSELSRPWSRDEIIETLLAFSEIADMKACFFIDGLDEYFPHSEHDRLISELNSIVSLPNVKVCASSRPWAEFSESFGGSIQRLRLEDLTRGDIAEYVDGSLAAANPGGGHLNLQYSPQTLLNLGEKIKNRAQGVFLWVYLVVTAVKERLKARSSVDQLFDCVNYFPSALEDYFRGLIYDRIHETMRKDTAQSLKLAWLVLQYSDEHSRRLQLDQAKTTNASVAEDEPEDEKRHDMKDLIDNTMIATAVPFGISADVFMDPPAFASDLDILRSFIPFWVLRSGVHDSTFATKTKFQVVKESMLGDMVSTVRQYLGASCKDLLWISHVVGGKRKGPTEYRVEFLHRTVYDFLSSQEMADLLDVNVPQHLLDNTFIADITLASLKITFASPSGSNDQYTSPCLEFLDAANGLVHTLRTQESNLADQVPWSWRELDDVGRRILSVFGTPGWLYLPPYYPVMEFLIARRLYGFSKAFLQRQTLLRPGRATSTVVSHGTDPPDEPPSRAFALLLASLGLRLPLTFPVERVDEHLVLALLQGNATPDAFVSRRSCTRSVATVWTTFLQEWLSSSGADSRSIPTDAGSIVETPSSLKKWRLAKSMIRFHADLTAVVCGEAVTLSETHQAPNSAPPSQSSSESHRHYSAREVLNKCVPSSRKSELDTFCRMGGSPQYLSLEIEPGS